MHYYSFWSARTSTSLKTIHISPIFISYHQYSKSFKIIAHKLSFLFQGAVDDLNSDFDLSSLIEGVVDDDSDGGGHEAAEVKTVKNDSGSAVNKKPKVVKYLEPLKVGYTPDY